MLYEYNVMIGQYKSLENRNHWTIGQFKSLDSINHWTV